jgi:hypothetical protein
MKQTVLSLRPFRFDYNNFPEAIDTIGLVGFGVMEAVWAEFGIGAWQANSG